MVSAMDAAMRTNPVAMEIVAMSGIFVAPMGFATDVVGQTNPAVKVTYARNGRSVTQMIYVMDVEVMKNHVAKGMYVIVTTIAALITSAQIVEDMINLVVKVMYVMNGMSVIRRESANHVARLVHAWGIAVERTTITMKRMKNATPMAM
jgi:hypothetical protein